MAVGATVAMGVEVPSQIEPVITPSSVGMALVGSPLPLVHPTASIADANNVAKTEAATARQDGVRFALICARFGWVL